MTAPAPTDLSTGSGRAASGATCLPILMRRPHHRSTADDPPGRYDAATDLWMVDGPGGPAPLAGLRMRSAPGDEVARRLEIETKTAVVDEGDDQTAFSVGMLLEIVTKTDAHQEGDDQAVQPGIEPL